MYAVVGVNGAAHARGRCHHGGVSWPFDDSQPLVTPDQHAEYMRRRAGLDEGQWALPPVLAATFQRAAWERLVAGIGEPAAGPAALGVPVLGRASGTPVAALWLPVGAPAAVLQLELAIARGVRIVVVVGSAGSLRPDLPTGSAVVVTGAEREDGTSHHYLPAGDVVTADPKLSEQLRRRADTAGLRPACGRAWTIDAPFRETVGAIRRHRDSGVLVVEMEAAAIFALAIVRGIRAGLIVAVSDELFGATWRPAFDDERYRASLQAAATVVLDCAAAG